MKKRILLFARDPGAANTLFPVFRRLQTVDGVDVSLLGKEFALDVYARAGLAGTDLSSLVPDATEAALVGFLREQAYDLIVTGVGSTDMTERLLWKAGEELGIISLALMDQWLNYEARFALVPPGSDVGAAVRVYPTFISSIDEWMKREMVAHGIPGGRIVITGQPYFETVHDCLRKLTDAHIRAAKQRLGIKDGEWVLSYASEPIVESYQDPWYLGYTQFSVFEAVVRALGRLELPRPVVLVVKLHPRNDKALFVERLKGILLPDGCRACFAEGGLSVSEVIAISDAVFGMSSMMLLETAIAQKPCLSVQIGLKREDPFILSRQGMVRTILSEDELRAALERLTKDGGRGIPAWQPALDASERIIQLIQTILYAPPGHQRRA